MVSLLLGAGNLDSNWGPLVAVGARQLTELDYWAYRYDIDSTTY
jgi:hypothetical protein